VVEDSSVEDVSNNTVHLTLFHNTLPKNSTTLFKANLTGVNKSRNMEHSGTSRNRANYHKINEKKERKKEKAIKETTKKQTNKQTNKI